MHDWLNQALLVGAGGFLGSVLRFALGGLVHRFLPFATFPYGTLAVNLSGCLAIGVLLGLAESRLVLNPSSRLFLTLGVLGGFTTFSTFGYETFTLLRGGDYFRAGANVTVSVAGGLLLLWLGYHLSGARWR